MTRFNLSEWAVHNRALVVFLMLVCVVGGISAYERLGRQEDPDFTVQTMVVQAVWPGATAADTLKQVTDRLEKKLEETPNLDYIKSYTKPGQATIFVYLKESTPKRELERHLVPGPQEGQRHQRRRCRKASSGRSSTTSSATSSASSTASPTTASRRARRATSPRPRAPSSCARPMSARSRFTATRTRRSISTSRLRSSPISSSASTTC